MNILKLFHRKKPCTHVGLAKDVLSTLNVAALQSGSFTSFWIMRCRCGALVGYPDANYRLALDHGTPETKKRIAELERR